MKIFIISILLLSLAAKAQPNKNIIPGKFIVVLGKGHTPEKLIKDYNLNPKHVYKKALNGFSVALSNRAHDDLLQDHRVAYIEQDQIVQAEETEDGATWGLDRIDQRSLPLNSEYNYFSSGLGVTAYIIDTGIRFNHVEFSGRASLGFDAFDEDGLDCNGHGTHVSGTVGGVTYGVAKDVTLKAVRVLNCQGSGSLSGVIAGIDWVIENAALPAVANLSLGTNGVSFAIDQAVQNMIFSGVQAAVAAGNSNKPACNYSPARVPDAITVGASGKNDNRASWSNHGACVDLFAPGENILSAWSTNPAASNIISGTSMATPHVTGVAALYLQTHPDADYQEVRDHLLIFSSKNKVTSANTSNNHLLYSLEVADGSGDYFSPSTEMTNPLNDSTVIRRSIVTLRSNAFDNISVSLVRFYSNGNLVCSDTTAPYSCSWRVPNSQNQAFYLQAVATDSAGNTAASPYVLVNTN